MVLLVLSMAWYPVSRTGRQECKISAKECRGRHSSSLSVFGRFAESLTLRTIN